MHLLNLARARMPPRPIARFFYLCAPNSHRIIIMHYPEQKNLNLPAIADEVLDWWEQHNVF